MTSDSAPCKPIVEEGITAITRRVFVSLPADQWLTKNQNDLKWGIVDEIERCGYKTEIFCDPRGKPGLSASVAWSADNVDRTMRRCCGVVIIGMPRWNFPSPKGKGSVLLPTEFAQYESAIAYTLNLPMLVFVQQDILRRGVFEDAYDGFIGQFLPSDDRTWLGTDRFKVPLLYWREKMENRRDVFLGYCSSSAKTAVKLKAYLQELGVTVLDWQTDFEMAGNILEQITEASKRCSTGIFLFTKDDKLTGGSNKSKAAPRDNVVFEAGYFIHAKGSRHVLIVREDGSKMPADLGGNIYASLKNKEDITPIQDSIKRFIRAQ